MDAGVKHFNVHIYSHYCITNTTIQTDTINLFCVSLLICRPFRSGRCKIIYNILVHPKLI